MAKIKKFLRKIKRNINKKKAGRRPFEFGKFMTALIVAFFLINFEGIVITSFILMFIKDDLSPLSELIIGTFSLAGTVITGAVGFYQWKTKAINIIKIKKALGMEILPDDINKKKTSYWDSEDDDYSDNVG